MTDTPAVAVDARLARGVTPESEVVGDGRVALTPVDDAGYAVIEVDAECVTARAAVPAVELVAAVLAAAGVPGAAAARDGVELTGDAGSWLDDVDDGAGCAETWRAACERRDAGGESG